MATIHFIQQGKGGVGGVAPAKPDTPSFAMNG